MTPQEARQSLETALQALSDGANATFQSAYEIATEEPPARVTLRGAVQHLNELPETGAEHGTTIQSVTVFVELRSRVDNPDAAELSAQYVAVRLPPLLRSDGIVVGDMRFVTPALPARDAPAPTHYAVSVVWDGLYQLGV